MPAPIPRPHVVLPVLALATALVASAAFAAIVWNKVYSGFSSPVEITQAHDGSGRLFVVEQGGAIRIIENGAVLATPFLDLGGPSGVTAASGEQGLLGLAFHPQFATNRQFYVNYTRKPRRRDRHRALHRERRQSRRRRSGVGDDPADDRAAGRRTTTAAPSSSAPTVCCTSAWATAAAPTTSTARLATRRTRRPSSGKILRIDVDGGSPYAIPPAIRLRPAWAAARRSSRLGVRNPWRFSFDRITGDFWIGDVGQGAVEEVDLPCRRAPAPAPISAGGSWRAIACTGLARHRIRAAIRR